MPSAPAYVHRFFKRLRVTAQREIEKAVRDAELAGTTLPTRAVVSVGGIDLKIEVDGDIELA
jgi:hypothetical protein